MEARMEKPKVAFICVHNSFRSQMAEAIAKIKAADIFDAYSAGTEIKDRINPDAVETIKRLYGVDMEKSQKPKLLADLPPVDIVITMGCNVSCPSVPCSFREDWGLGDPTGKGAETFEKTARIIEQKVIEMKSFISIKEKKQMSKTWYPVINYELCTECGTCTAKCRHGVFDMKKAPRPVVVYPEGCIRGCYGCGNLCPNGAIEYFGDVTQSSGEGCGCGCNTGSAGSKDSGCDCGGGCGCD